MTDGNAPAPTVPISFILCAHNGLALTRACLESLHRTVNLAGCEVILVDDASTDGTHEFFAALGPPHRLLRNHTRTGYAASNNRAAALARHDILCLLNNDLLLTDGWLKPMLDALARFPDAGFIANIQRNARTGRYEHMGIVFSDDGMPLHFGKYFPFRPFRGCRPFRAVTTACCLIRKSVFLAAGGFDTRFRNGSEDVDLCLRLHRAGHRHYLACESVIDHHVSASDGRFDHVAANEQLLAQRWAHIIRQSLSPAERRLFALNYLLRFATRPWRYNGPKLYRAIARLARFGH